jgi:hypothetical protein
MLRDSAIRSLGELPLPPGLSTCNRARPADHGAIAMQCAPLGNATALQVLLVEHDTDRIRLMSANTQGGFGNNRTDATTLDGGFSNGFECGAYQPG